MKVINLCFIHPASNPLYIMLKLKQRVSSDCVYTNVGIVGWIYKTKMDHLHLLVITANCNL